MELEDFVESQGVSMDDFEASASSMPRQGKTESAYSGNHGRRGNDFGG